MTECVFALELFQKLHLVFKDCSGKKTFETSVHSLVCCGICVTQSLVLRVVFCMLLFVLFIWPLYSLFL